MSRFISAAREQILIWWLVIFYLVMFSLVSLAFAMVTALYGVTWEGLSGQEKFVIGCLIFGNWGTVMMAFMNKSLNRAAAGELPISAEDAALIKPPKL
jgi:hypothetical protein